MGVHDIVAEMRLRKREEAIHEELMLRYERKKDYEHQRVSELVRQEISKHFDYVQQRNSNIRLYDQDALDIRVADATGLNLVVFTFRPVIHDIEIKASCVHYTLTAAIISSGLSTGKPMTQVTKHGTPTGAFTDDKIVDAVREAINTLVAGE